MKRLIQGLAVVAVLGMLVVVGILVWGGPKLRAFPAMPSTYEAKEYCSCRFVSKRDEAFCDAFIFQDIVPTQGRVVDEEHKTVTASALLVSTTAHYVDDRVGCVIQ